MIRLIFIAALITALVFVLFKIFRSFGSVFRIDIRKSRMEIRGTVPGRAWSDVRAFLRELPLPERCHIIGLAATPRFRLVFSDNIDEGTQQRIRNYLYL